ncbi:MAG TPA: tRNA (adenosine(37)-N6)-dimethylallyltransferase MiaA [Ignavibacteriaceae bacterium]|nr:tRNA (adenosine(37)-N6)-dimethylallyltransferase MiaA [Ignavibacteriaceae bacterium]
MERTVIVIAGPTCSGKSSLGFLLAKKLNSEIISADSRQVYKYLNIGTAKPDAKILSEIKHHFIDKLDPTEEFNVSKFEKSSLNIFKELFNVHKKPIVVGGSGLYVRALVDGLFEIEDNDEEYRKHLSDLRKNNGNEFLYEKLMSIDPDAAARMLPQNWKRVMRALEVHHITGRKISDLHKEYEREVNIKFFQFALDWERNILYERINNRVDEMIRNGLVKEVKSILEKGFSKELNALNTVGYKEIIMYLKNEITLERAIELIKRNTRHFAKRQLTWFNADKRIYWFKINSENQLNEISNSIIELSE